MTGVTATAFGVVGSSVPSAFFGAGPANGRLSGASADAVINKFSRPGHFPAIRKSPVEIEISPFYINPCWRSPRRSHRSVIQANGLHHQLPRRKSIPSNCSPRPWRLRLRSLFVFLFSKNHPAKVIRVLGQPARYNGERRMVRHSPQTPLQPTRLGLSACLDSFIHVHGVRLPSRRPRGHGNRLPTYFPPRTWCPRPLCDAVGREFRLDAAVLSGEEACCGIGEYWGFGGLVDGDDLVVLGS